MLNVLAVVLMFISLLFLNTLLLRGIDHAIVNNEIPDGVHELPSLLKHVCGHNKNEILLQATSMMLMASLKTRKLVLVAVQEA
ncbi:E4 SUMO-protein ligase PIAL2-like isoform X2 [Papaver somniferum]|uniref:E4 SUMO-protein ligase PIAL2-like isoform X2 n=1 Tax=Papaver somniferum TaxID=3469 RepID=UPI000E6F4F19|nr:E4 SUMO-protein ligase PIAL2-like isoform X2 [Papaver somniferum]